ncbi:SH3 domain-containing protein [Phenylobacterium sp. J367]|uniref:SH3 domain-containing protein n=1 Tax=Phenylobacterium sp. J367 TaxID=2898435 RepID=UPI002151DEEE|nr:SH3 domain-containing protein [Phenylobacterium sp. J367]MCR5879680.1 SH3 domain-containing protein [Phenylobacterium sp. J367]
MRTLKINKLIGGGAAAAVLAGAMAMSAGSAQAAGINGVTNCSAPGGKQEMGALLGAVAGGLLGNKVGGKHPTGETVIGAGVGAAAGSAIGCQMQKKDERQAYARGSTYTRNGYRLSSAIAPASYSKLGDTFVANRTVNLRSAPTTNSGRVGSLRTGERFQAMAHVRGTDWILVGQGGVGVGYVHQAYVQPEGYRYARY